MKSRRLLLSVALVVALGLTIVVPAGAECEPPCGPEPPCGGCTPGYWRQPHHFDSWTSPYHPEMQIQEAFGCGPANTTLLDGLTARGGGENAFMRQAVAALLNAAHPDMTYGTVDGVKSIACNNWGSEWAKDWFEGWNESLPCLLDGGGASGQPSPRGRGG